MSRVDLPDGGWAELCAPRKVPERKRRRYLASMADASSATADLPRDPKDPDEPDPKRLTGPHMDLFRRMGDMLILCRVREWSFGEVTEDAVADLDGETYDALIVAARGDAEELTPDFSPDPDPKAPTSGSTAPPPG